MWTPWKEPVQTWMARINNTTMNYNNKQSIITQDGGTFFLSIGSIHTLMEHPTAVHFRLLFWR